MTVSIAECDLPALSVFTTSSLAANSVGEETDTGERPRMLSTVSDSG